MSRKFDLGSSILFEKKETFIVFFQHFFLNSINQKLGPMKHLDFNYVSMKCHCLIQIIT